MKDLIPCLVNLCLLSSDRMQLASRNQIHGEPAVFKNYSRGHNERI